MLYASDCSCNKEMPALGQENSQIKAILPYSCMCHIILCSQKVPHHGHRVIVIILCVQVIHMGLSLSSLHDVIELNYVHLRSYLFIQSTASCMIHVGYVLHVI